ncbi:LEM domain-containing protein 2 isoform X2 [Lepisosteus oculatus]|uniref:LEM domain-containing protein 2 isoform X2 n=1 Tax=Lepisosteus oculatus TaxID=7918 RepID=UPI00371D1233
MAAFSDELLRRELKSFGYSPGPISDYTRKLYQKKLQKLQATVDYNRVHLLRGQSYIHSRHRHSSGSPRHRQRTASFHRDSEDSDDDDDDDDDEDDYGSRVRDTREDSRNRRLSDSTNFSFFRRVDAQRLYDGSTRRNRFCERQLSRVLLACTVILSLILIWLVYMKTVSLGQAENANSNIQGLSVDCDGKTDTYCRAQEQRVQLQLLSELYSFLAKVAGDFECGNPSKLTNACVPIEDVRTYLVILNKDYASKLEAALEWILQSETDLGIQLVGEDPSEPVVSVQAVQCVQSSWPSRSLDCRLSLALVTALQRTFIFILALGVMWGVLVLLRYRWRRLQEDEQAMYELVHRIIAAVREHYKDWDQGLEPLPYVPIPHIRDSLIPPQNRRRMRRVWDKAVEFLASHESRIRTESHRVGGEDFLVWRWTQPSEMSDSS